VLLGPWPQKGTDNICSSLFWGILWQTDRDVQNKTSFLRQKWSYLMTTTRWLVSYKFIKLQRLLVKIAVDVLAMTSEDSRSDCRNLDNSSTNTSCSLTSIRSLTVTVSNPDTYQLAVQQRRHLLECQHSSDLLHYPVAIIRLPRLIATVKNSEENDNGVTHTPKARFSYRSP